MCPPFVRWSPSYHLFQLLAASQEKPNERVSKPDGKTLKNWVNYCAIIFGQKLQKWVDILLV
jgi:hypothetical protein